MRKFSTPEALVAAYWRKLTRPIRAIYKSRGRMGRGAELQRQRGSDRPVSVARRPYRRGPTLGRIRSA
jgi:hypothetical protein